ncbi:deoxyribose-phosphate aldolase [Fusibacter bizertensis]|jgi:deoxyribose-phosphate aldolase|uniref:Deoxyribose-phosphate aldolase n=1 Tax=Fusibacter bizertensis TaxID=1488331 RepID=A0ABT6N806_9FIRM|nr:deoxyribose-phosphate aldolase [Fusibacter bizertensis]MDH8676554.1 deoxyribose-phosphate aldolase [Fusibacter bizertensis]
MNIAKTIDHTILKPNVTDADVIKICNEAKTHGFFSVCVNPYFVPLVASELKGSEVKVTSVIGFPLGASTTFIKAAEAKKAVEDGANEIDMVINVSALKDGKYDFVKSDIAAVVEAIKGNAILKVILETCLLTKDEIVKACELSKEAGAQFVKTSTGFSTGGATAEDVALMKKTVGEALEVKASGGVRDYETAMAMINAGATRIGASASIDIANKSNTSTSDY